MLQTSKQATMADSDHHQMELVKVTHIEDSITFWAQSITSDEAIEQMNITLGEVCPKSQRLHGVPSFNKIYGALFSKDNNWYRCKLQMDMDDKFMVSYFDYGNREVVCRSAIVELPEDLQQSPSLAKKYQFWGLHVDPESPSYQLGYLQNQMYSQTVRVHKRAVSFDGTILVQAFHGFMDIGETLVKMKLAQGNVPWSQRENPPLKDPAVSWLQQMMERGQGIDGISTFPPSMPKLRPVFTDQKPSSPTERAINGSKPAIAAEKTIDFTNTVEKTMDVSNAVENTMDVANASTVEKKMDVTDTAEKKIDTVILEENQRLKEELQDQKQHCLQVEKELKEGSANLSKEAEHVESLQAVVTNTSQQLQKRMQDEKNIDTVILENQRLKAELEVQKRHCLQKEKELKDSYAEIQELKEGSAKLSKEAQRLETLQAVVTNTSQQLQKRMQDEKNIDTVILENQRLKAELEVQKQHCLQKEKELKDAYAEIQELKESSANLSKEMQSLETLVDDVTNESQQLQKRLQDADLTMQVMKEEIVKKEKEMDKLLHAGIAEQLGRLVEKVHDLREIRKSLLAGDGDTLMDTLTVVQNSMSAPVATQELEVAWKDYMCVQEKLKACEKQEEVYDLVDQKNKIRSVVTAAADRFLEAAKPLPVRERMETLEEVSASLTAVFGPSSEEDVEEHIIEEYHQWVKEKEQHMTSIRDDSNNALNTLSTWASNVGKFFSLSNETLVTMKDVIDGADRVLNLAELNVCRELDVCLFRVGQIEQDGRVITRVFHKVMQDIQKEKKVLIDIMDKYLFHIKFKESQDVSPSPATLLQIKKKIRCFKSQLRWRQVEKNSLEEAEELDLTEISKKSEEIAETRNLLFQEIHKEKEEYNKLRVLAEGEFPELPLLYPEVDLNIFMRSGGLLINSLDRDLFDAEPVRELSDHRPLVCTEFQGQRVLLKSYTINEEMEVRVLEGTTLFHRAATENKEDSGLLPLLALFFSKSDPVAYLMVPYFPNGSLKVVQAVNPLMDTEVVRVMKGVARGLQALHTMGVTHGSLNPSNTFVVNRSRGLVGDFDFTKTLEQRAVNNGLAGSIDLVAPELRQGITTPPPPACDMFAFGRLMLWLHVPEFNGSLDNLEPLSLESKLGDLLSKLLWSGERLTAMEVLACEYFTVDL